MLLATFRRKHRSTSSNGGTPTAERSSRVGPGPARVDLLRDYSRDAYLLFVPFRLRVLATSIYYCQPMDGRSAGVLSRQCQALPCVIRRVNLADMHLSTDGFGKCYHKPDNLRQWRLLHVPDPLLALYIATCYCRTCHAASSVALSISVFCECVLDSTD